MLFELSLTIENCQAVAQLVSLLSLTGAFRYHEFAFEANP
jgi:hypothetical protein